MKGLKKIAITGPESTGKSWLAQKLARSFNTVFVPEYARNYIDQLNRDYKQEDILEIAKGQFNLEKEMESKATGILFCDTEFLVTKIWSLHKYNNCNPFILEKIKENRYDLFLLCDVDMPWEFDEQREHPHLRSYFFNWYEKELREYGFSFRVISGLGEHRFLNARNEVIRFMENFKEQ